MCSLALALTGLTTGLQVAGQYQQSRAQASAYEAQADAARQNAKIQNRQSEQIAENAAQEQRKLDARMRMVAGQQAAQTGASGIQGGVGSALDVYNASMDAWQEDTQNALWNQRNNTYNSYVREVNFRNQANAYDAQASSAKRAGNMAILGTLLGSAVSLYGMGGAGSSSKAAVTTGGRAQMPTAAGYRAIATDTAFGGTAGYTPQTVKTSWGGFLKAPQTYDLGWKPPKYTFNNWGY